MSPGSPSYERLEGGNMNSQPQRSSNRFASASRMSWKKGAIAGIVVLGFLWFTSGGSSSTPEVLDLDLPEAPAAPTPPSPPSYPKPVKPPSPPEIPTVEHEPSTDQTEVDAVHPTSFETDPNPLSTTYCSASRAAHLPLVQYALMIDAGSTGSRIHVYKFNNCPSETSSPIYEYETFAMTTPGLSSFPDSPSDAADSLKELLDVALKTVPSSLQKCTPIAVKATAGLRLLGEKKADAILKEIRTRLDQKYPFDVKTIEVMNGREEGVYAWITANYLLGTLTSTDGSYAVLDLGGASTQIVFEPIFTAANEKMVEGEHKYELIYGEAAAKRELYQHSYLGYGLKEARRHVHRLVEFVSTQIGEDSSTASSPNTIPNPCLIQSTMQSIVVDKDTGLEVEMRGEDVGSYEACKRLVEIVLAKDRICASKPCSFNGVYQPSLLDTFLGETHDVDTAQPAKGGKVLLLSYFFDRIDMLLPFDIDIAKHQNLLNDADPDASVVTLDTIADLARVVCNGNKSGEWGRYWTSKEVLKDLAERPEHCLDLTFIHTLLSVGYEFPATQEMKVAKRVDGTELGWCLGATVVELLAGGDMRCTA